MPFWWMSDEEHALYEKAKTELLKDLKENPSGILKSGYISFEHNPGKTPMISKITYRYNGKEYQFIVGKIKIREVNTGET